MSKKSRFRKPFEKQHGKRAQALPKSASQHLYQIHWSLAGKLCWKKSVLLTYEILGLLVNTLATDEKYPVFNRDKLTIPIQMQLSKEQKKMSVLFATFLKYRLTFEHFEKKMILTASVVPKLGNLKMWLDKCLKILASEDPFRSNMVNVWKHC